MQKRKFLLPILIVMGIAITACGKSDEVSETEAAEETAELQTIEFDTGSEQPVEAAEVTTPEPIVEEPVVTDTSLAEVSQDTTGEPAEAVAAEPAENAEETPAASTDYTVEDIGETTLYATETVNMRKGPSSADFEVAGKLSAGSEVKANGKVNGYKGDGKTWYRIKRSNGPEDVFVIADYLSDKKPEKKEETTDTAAAATDTAATDEAAAAAAKKAAEAAAAKAAADAAAAAATTAPATTTPATTTPAATGYAQYGERAQCAKDWDDTRAAGYGQTWAQLSAGLQTDLYNHWVAKGPTW